MKSIEPFNKVWLDCYNNLKLSLLINISPEYEIRGYENRYKYFCVEHVAGSGQVVNCITEEQSFIHCNEFAQIEKINPDSEKEFLEIVINQLKKETGFVLMRTDLYDWLEGSVCWHNYHWDHYSLLVDYDEKQDKIVAFDEAGGQYKKLFVNREKLYGHLFNNPKFEKIRLITISDSVSLHPISLQRLVNNAERIVDSIENCLGKEFWYMQKSDYESFWYNDLNGIYLQRIEGRQKANAHLMKELANRVENLSKELMYLRDEFEELSSNWATIRMALYLIYQKEKSRGERLNEINEKVKDFLLREKEVWRKFADSANNQDLSINIIS